MRVRESWVTAREELAAEGIADAAIEAEVLLRHALSLSRAEFFAALDELVERPGQQEIDGLVRRRVGREPLAYILGCREFYGVELIVNEDVLVPRQETELLVDKVLQFAEGKAGRRLTVADIGTGSGAVAVAVARHVRQATVYATDPSREALAVADANRRRHGVADRVHLRLGEFLDPLPAPVDIVVTNPPYLGTSEIAQLQPEVQQEPRTALDGGPDGLRVTERLLREAPEYLRPGGQMVVEIAPEQLDRVVRMARSAFPTAGISFDRDLLSLPRVVSVETARS